MQPNAEGLFEDAKEKCTGLLEMPQCRPGKLRWSDRKPLTHPPSTPAPAGGLRRGQAIDSSQGRKKNQVWPSQWKGKNTRVQISDHGEKNSGASRQRKGGSTGGEFPRLTEISLLKEPAPNQQSAE